jgi:hypothetical protein
MSCGASFFSSATVAALQAHFGGLSCFRFVGRDSWIMVGSGETVAGGSAAPGGSIVAVERCTASDAQCLSATATRDFAAFTVAYGPKPDSWPERLGATFGGRLLLISDASCGLYLFDVNSLKWFPAGGPNPVTVGALMNNGNAAGPAQTPATRAGSAALVSGPPASTGDCEIP